MGEVDDLDGAGGRVKTRFWGVDSINGCRVRVGRGWFCTLSEGGGVNV